MSNSLTIVKCIPVIYNVCTFLCLLLFFIPFSDASVSSDKSEPNDYTELLLTAEGLRLTDPDGFSDRLESLRLLQSDMSSYQKCHLDYLNSYELAYQGKANDAILLLNEGVNVCEDLRVKVRMFGMLANLHVILGDFEKASYNIDVAIRNIELTQDKPTRVLGYSAASIVYDILKQNELSAKYANLLYQTEPTLSNLCKATYYKYLHIFETAADQVIDSEVINAVDQCKASSIYIQGLFLKIKHAEFKIEHAKTDKNLARELVKELKDVEAEVLSVGYKVLEAVYYSTLSYVNLLANDLVAAEQNALKSNQLNQGLGNAKHYIVALQVLEAVAKSNSDYPGAYAFLAQRSEAEKAMYDVNQSKQMAYMTVKHANLARVFEIEQLNQQNSVLELEKQLARQEANNQKLIILLILTVLGFLVLWMMKIKKRHDYFKGVSEIDHLTKVLTRKAFEDQMNALLERAQQDKRPVHLAIMDLDHFKDVNDNHGHLIGDWVLKNVIYACKELVEENMIIARLGGEEFCVAMADVDQEVMHDKLEAMRLAIANLDCTDSGAQLSVSASFGVTSSVTSGYSLPLLLTHADVALFDAKKNGRNQVVKFKVLKTRK